MRTENFYKMLGYVDKSRENRSANAQKIIDDPSLIKPCLQILFQVEDPVSVRAGWLLDISCASKIELLYPYLKYFLKNIHTVHLDGAVRPVSRICEFLVLDHYRTGTSKLTYENKEQITENCFNWLLTDQKVAVKAHAMLSLYHLGTEITWIHPELKCILEEGFSTGSAAYKARARHILAKIA